MAIYHLSAKVHKRSMGANAIKGAAYRMGARVVDHDAGKTYNYTRKKEVGESGFVAPDGFRQEWISNPFAFFQLVEKSETYKNAQLGIELEVSLPHELKPDAWAHILDDFLDPMADDRRVAQWTIHDKPGNGHAHIWLSQRRLNADGSFGKTKVREWNAKEYLAAQRQRWADVVNKHLELHGYDDNHFIDHRTCAEQGKDNKRAYMHKEEYRLHRVRATIANAEAKLTQLCAQRDAYRQRNQSRARGRIANAPSPLESTRTKKPDVQHRIANSIPPRTMRQDIGKSWVSLGPLEGDGVTEVYRYLSDDIAADNAATLKRIIAEREAALAYLARHPPEAESSEAEGRVINQAQAHEAEGRGESEKHAPKLQAQARAVAFDYNLLRQDNIKGRAEIKALTEFVRSNNIALTSLYRYITNASFGQRPQVGKYMLIACDAHGGVITTRYGKLAYLSREDIEKQAKPMEPRPGLMLHLSPLANQQPQHTQANVPWLTKPQAQQEQQENIPWASNSEPSFTPY